MGRGRRHPSRKEREAAGHRTRYEVDASSGFVEEWRAVAAFATALASRPHAEALLDHALPATELDAVAGALALELDGEKIAGIRQRAARSLDAEATGSEPASLLTSARRHARRSAAAELGLLAAAAGLERAVMLSPSYRPRRHERAALAGTSLWEELVAVHWTTLPIFTADHFHRFFLQALPRQRSRPSRAVDAVLAHGPSSGAAGGAEATAVLAATTAATAD